MNNHYAFVSMIKHGYQYLFLFVSLLMTDAACRSKPQTTATADSTAASQMDTPETTAKPITLTERLTALGVTQTGHWRGISLGDPMTTVATVEKEKPFEQDAAHVGYTLEFSNLESADFLYYQQGGKVSAIDVDLYLNTRQSVDAYQKDLTDYFNQRYGKPTPNATISTWTGPKGEVITLKDVSKGKDFGLKAKIAPASTGTLSASRK